MRRKRGHATILIAAFWRGVVMMKVDTLIEEDTSSISLERVMFRDEKATGKVFCRFYAQA